MRKVIKRYLLRDIVLLIFAVALIISYIDNLIIVRIILTYLDSGIAYLFSLTIGISVSESFLLVFNSSVLFIFIILKFLTRVSITNYIIILYLSFILNYMPIILKISERTHGDIIFYTRSIFILLAYLIIVYIDNKNKTTVYKA